MVQQHPQLQISQQSKKKSSSSITQHQPQPASSQPQQHSLQQGKVSTTHSSSTSSNEAVRQTTSKGKEPSRQVSPAAAAASGSSKMSTNQGYNLQPQTRPTTNDYSNYSQSYADFSRQNYVKMPQAASGQYSKRSQVQNQGQMNMFVTNDHQYPSYQLMPAPLPHNPAAAGTATAVEGQGDTFFSVNQLVNPSKIPPQFISNAKKASKRSAPSASSSTSNTSSRYAKQSRSAISETAAKNTDNNGGKKDEQRKSSKKPTSNHSTRSLTQPPSVAPSASNSSRSSSSKRSYTAESLFIQDAVVQPASNLVQPAGLPTASANPNQSVQSSASGRHHHYSHHHHHHTHRSQAEKSQTRLPELNWNDTSGSSSHFASFPSISPSPNLFSQDFANFDFSSSMFNTTPDMSTTTSGVSGNSSSKNLQQNQHQRNQMLHQDYIQSVHDQQLFDANFFTNTGSSTTGNPGGALTPPSSIYHHQSQDSHHHHHHEGYGSSNFPRSYSKSTPRATQQMQVQSGSGSSQQMMTTGNDLQGYASQQLSAVGGSSYVNFNLSTIFPEINVTAASDKLAAAALLPPPPPAAVAPSLRTSSTSSVITSSASDFRTPTTATDILPHSIAIFGAASHPPPTPHQMSFGSFAATSFSTTPAVATSSINNFGLNE